MHQKPVKIHLNGNHLSQSVFIVCSLVLSLIYLNGVFAQDTLSFSECINIGLEGNYDLQIVRNNEAMAENNLTLGNAGFLPTLDAGGRILKRIVNSEQVFFSRPDEPQIRDNAESSST